MKFYSIMKMGLWLCMMFLSACSNAALPSSVPDSFVMANDSLCASPNVIAVDGLEGSKLVINGQDVSLIKHTGLISEVFVPVSKEFNFPRVVVPRFVQFPQCWDKSIYKFSISELVDGPEFSKTYFFHLKFVNLKDIELDANYVCSLERTHNFTARGIPDTPVKYKLCRYTKEKILSDGLHVTPLELCRLIEPEECYRRVLAERRRVVDLKDLNLLRDVDGFDVNDLGRKMAITSEAAELFKLRYSDGIYIKYKDLLTDPDCYNPVEPEACSISVTRKLRERNQISAKALEDVLLISLEAQKALSNIAEP